MQLSIEPCTGYIVQTKTLTEINDLFNSGKLDTYSVWLQRLKQKDKWAKNDWEKARSYLFRLLTSGSCSKSIFTVVDIDMLIDTIEGRLEFSTSKDVRFDIFNVMVEDLKIMKEKGFRRSRVATTIWFQSKQYCVWPLHQSLKPSGPASLFHCSGSEVWMYWLQVL